MRIIFNLIIKLSYLLNLLLHLLLSYHLLSFLPCHIFRRSFKSWLTLVWVSYRCDWSSGSSNRVDSLSNGLWLDQRLSTSGHEWVVLRDRWLLTVGTTWLDDKILSLPISFLFSSLIFSSTLPHIIKKNEGHNTAHDHCNNYSHSL